MEKVIDYLIKGEQITLAREGETGTHFNVFSLGTIGSWSELLGITDPGEVLDAILYVADNGEPEPDPVTGENAWTASYLALGEREQQRAAEVIVAKTEGRSTDPRSPLLRSRMATLSMVDTVADAQAATRAKLGLPEPGMQRRTMSTMSRGTPSPLDALKASLVTDLAPAIAEARQEFIDTLSPTQETP